MSCLPHVLRLGLSSRLLLNSHLCLQSYGRPLSTRTISTGVAPPSTDAEPTPLAGTAPVHRCYVLLHTSQPPSVYPAKYSTTIQRQLLRTIVPWGGAVNFAWSPSQSHTEEDSTTEIETYRMTAFSSARGKLEIEAVSLANVDEIAEALHTHAEPVSNHSCSCTSDSDDAIYLYVCTHGARDCRCGETGGAVARAIREELKRSNISNPHNSGTPVRWQLSEVAHVGGHKYAGNVLVYPHGEWLGNVRPENVAEIMDAILARPIRPMRANEPPVCPSHWRGRMGLNKDEQIALFSRFSDEPTRVRG